MKPLMDIAKECGIQFGESDVSRDIISRRQLESVVAAALAQHQAKALDGVEPVAYRFTENRGNGYTEFNSYGLDEVGSAYRDNCLEIVPLYSAATVSALQARIAELEVDAARYRKLLELWNGRDMRELFGIEDFAAIDAARKESK